MLNPTFRIRNLFLGFFLVLLFSPALLIAQNVETFTSSTPLSVPKNSTGSSTLSVTATHAPATMNASWGIYRVWVDIDIPDKMQYLTLSLTAPNGVVSRLVTAPGPITTYSNFQDTYFRDDAPMTLASLYAVAGANKHNNCGSWIPQNSLNTTYNTPGTYGTNGTWTLTITNTYTNVGTYTAVLNNWGIEFRDTPGGSSGTSVWVQNSEAGYPAYDDCATPKKMDKYFNYYGRTRISYHCDLATDPPISPSKWLAGSNMNLTLDNTIWYSFMTDETGGTVKVLISYNAKYSGFGYQATVVGSANPCVAASWTQTAGSAYYGGSASALGGTAVGTNVIYNSEIICTGLAPNTVYYICVDGTGNSSGGNCTGGTPESDVDFQIEATGAIKSNFSTLPIELGSFNAACEDQNILLKWSTYSETNNHFFTIEKSMDALNYVTVAMVPGAGNSNTLLHYEFSDSEILSGTVYYRLMQTDYDGKFEYFSPVEVHCSDMNADEPQMEIYPNPANSECMLGLKNLKGAEVRVKIANGLGQTITTSTYFPGSGHFSAVLDISGFPKGIYYLIGQTENASLKCLKLIVQ